MSLPDPFTKELELPKGGLKFFQLHINGDIIAVDQLIHYDDQDFYGCVPCNSLSEPNPEGDYLNDDLLYTIGSHIQLPNVFVGFGGGASAYKGLTFDSTYSNAGNTSLGFDLEFDNETIGSESATINYKNASEIQLGNSNIPIVDENGPVYGLTVNIIDNNLELPYWDRYLDVDSYLINGAYTCSDNAYGLSTARHCRTCEERQGKYIASDQAECEDCMARACGEYVDYQYYVDPNTVPDLNSCTIMPTDYSCYCLQAGNTVDYYPHSYWSGPTQSTIIDATLIDGPDPKRYYCEYTLLAPIGEEYTDGNGNLNFRLKSIKYSTAEDNGDFISNFQDSEGDGISVGVSEDQISKFFNSQCERGNHKIPCSFKEVEDEVNEGSQLYACLPGENRDSNIRAIANCRDFRHNFDQQIYDECKAEYKYISRKYWDCFEDCGSPDGPRGTPCFNESKGENRVDIAETFCHCGGEYKSEENLDCGWEAILNKIPYTA